MNIDLFTKKVLVVVLVCFSTHIQAQNNSRIIVDIKKENKPWNNLNLNNAPESFQFAIVTDRTGGHRPGVFLEGIKKLNLLRPEFVMSVGDLIEGYTEDESVLDEQWAEFNGFIDSLDAPFFYIPGNHDITNRTMEKKWQENFGVTYYHFVYKDVLFLCLNSEDNYRGSGRGTVDDKQFAYIRKTLKQNANVKWTLVFIHQPLWIQENTKRWKDVEDLLSDRPHNVFAGHYHRYFKMDRNNGKYFTLATTGGSSRMRGKDYGEFDHVVWATMTEEGPIIANLFLDGIWSEDVVTEDIIDLVREKPFPVRIEPVFLESGDISPIVTPIKIINDSDNPMTVFLDALAHPKMFYTLDKQQITVPPNSVEVFNLTLTNETDVDIRLIRPIRVDARVVYEYEDRPNVELNSLLHFTPFIKKTTFRSDDTILIDGNIKEWKTDWTALGNSNMIGRPFDYEGETDCSIKFSTTYDDQNLYISFDITDDEIFIDENAPMWDQDALIIDLDGRPEHVSTRNIGEGRNREWLSYLRTFQTDNGVYKEEDMPAGTVSAFQLTESGVHVEVAFPLEYLNSQQPGSETWKNFRLGVKYYDYDKNGEQRTEHYWYPTWSSQDNIPGSGLIFRK